MRCLLEVKLSVGYLSVEFKQGIKVIITNLEVIGIHTLGGDVKPLAILIVILERATVLLGHRHRTKTSGWNNKHYNSNNNYGNHH